MLFGRDDNGEGGGGGGSHRVVGETGALLGELGMDNITISESGHSATAWQQGSMRW